MNQPPYRLAILASHPIQYQVPLFRALAARPEIDLHVFFCSKMATRTYMDSGFRVRLSWDIPLLEGYQHSFLHNFSFSDGPTWFGGIFNPGILIKIASGRYDAIWIHGWGLATNWIALAGAAALDIPILLRGESNGLAEPTGLKGALKRFMLRRLFKQISAFLAIGTNNVEFYRSYGIPDDCIFMTPYAVDNAFFMERARQLSGQQKRLREQAGLPSDRPVILFCGKFQKKKRPLDLLKAFALLHDQPAVSLVFVGDGPLRSDLEREVTTRRLRHVYFLGFKNQQELPACYAMADVLVLPSDFEPWGLVVNEAMCCGLPIIASDQVGAAADLVREGNNGFTYPVGSVQTLAERLRQVLTNEPMLMNMGRHSIDIVSKWGYTENTEGLLKSLHYIRSGQTLQR